MPVGNNEHQRIDDISTDLIYYIIYSLEIIGFFVMHDLFDCLLIS